MTSLGSLTASRSVVAWVLGLFGTFGAVLGWGPVQYSPSTQGSGLGRIAVVSAAFVLVGLLWRSRPLVVVTAAIASVPLATALTAANLGRAPGLIAALSVVVSWAAIVPVVDGREGGFAAGRGRWLLDHLPLRTVLVAVALVAVAQTLWIADAPVVAVLALLLSAAASVGVASTTPRLIASVEEPLHRWVDAARGAVGGGNVKHRIARVPVWTWWAVVSAGAMAAVMAPVFTRYAAEPASVLGFGDYEVHLDIASKVEFFPPHVAAPHPVFHLAVAATTWLGGLVAATTLVMSIVIAGTVLTLVWFGRQPYAGRPPLDPALAIAYGVGYFLVEAPGKIAAALNIGNPYDWPSTNHMFLSPTDTMLVPFAVALVYLTGRTIAGAKTVRDGWVLAAATTITTIVKPSMTLPLLAAIPIVLLCSRRLDRPTIRFMLAWFYVPSAVVVGLQTWMLEAGVEGLPKAGIAVRPMDTIRSVGLDRVGPLLFAPLVVVLLCLWAGRRRYLSEPSVQLSLWSMAASLAILFLFNETGERSSDGTFTKPAFICFIVLHLVSWRFLAGEYRFGDDRKRRAWMPVATVFLAVGVIAGVLAYLDALGLILADRGRA